jgi:hypothetical protein
VDDAIARRITTAAAEKIAAEGGLLTLGSTDGQPFPAGPHGGALYCGHSTRGGTKAFVCAWADKVTFGAVVYIYGSASSLGEAASKTNQVRSVIGN